LDTLEELFRGSRELFEGLWIGSSDYEFEQRPVIRLNMGLSSSSPLELKADLLDKLTEIMEKEKLDISPKPSPNRAMSSLIAAMAEKYGQKVVVLIDEYDLPVSDNLDDITQARDVSLAMANSKVLKPFYIALKDSQEYLHFVFVTGVTRYSLMGLSSGMNHLTDLTLKPQYATICGFTLDELDKYFSDRYTETLAALKLKDNNFKDNSTMDLRQKILDWYDGYTWDGKTHVINPFSILKFFEEQLFSSYWANLYPSATFLSKTIAKDPLVLNFEMKTGLVASKIEVADIGGLGTVPSLFQTGYLTVDKIIPSVSGGPIYTFRPPNREVSEDFFQSLSEHLDSLLFAEELKDPHPFIEAIESQNPLELYKHIYSLYKGIPKKYQEDNENFFRSVLYGYGSGVTTEAWVELASYGGQKDLVLRWGEGNYAIFELKYQKTSQTKCLDKILTNLAIKALSAIKAKKYYDSILSKATKGLYLIGVGVTTGGEIKVHFGEPPTICAE
jgi:hypothetical protein